jgi:hypothetical protein
MPSQSNTPRQATPSINDRFVKATALATQLGKDMRGMLLTKNDLQLLQQAVDALPIATHEYGWIQTRIGNAQVYAEHREFHAAAYELDLVAHRLRSCG